MPLSIAGSLYQNLNLSAPLQSMKNITFLLILTLCLHAVYSFQLQGAWSLTQIQAYPIIYQPVILEITDTVHRQTTILQNMVFSGCQTYRYLLQFNDNNLFIRYSSIKYDTSNQLPMNSSIRCTDNTAKMHAIIRSKLVSVFYFQIVGNFLVFLNPNRQVVFKFERVQAVRPRNLRGIWNLRSLRSTSLSQRVEISDTQITLCQGRLILGYTLTQKYGFRSRLISNDGCNVQDLESSFLSSAFSRRIGTELQIYNSALDLLMLMSYVQEIDLSAAQENRLKAIDEARRNEQTAAQLRSQAEARARAEAQARTKAQAQSLSTSLTLTNTKEDILGLWQPVSIFGMPMEGSSQYFIFSSNLISFNGGCNNIQFQYTVNQSSKLIQIGQNRSTSNTCDVNDDGLFVNAISRASRYTVTIVGREFRLRLADMSGNVFYQLRKTVQVASNPINPASPTNLNPSNLPAVIPPFPGLEPGRYVFLVLARRDLPRRFCTITAAKISYSGCNTIEHSYSVTGENQIRIIGGATSTGNKCTVNNDQILSNAFNSITSFVPGIEAGSYVFRNARNESVINLSLF